MATSLEMNAMKSNSFSVKDLLDLPAEGKGVMACSHTAPRGDGSLDLSAARGMGPPDLGPMAGQYYDNSDNPFTRWLQNNDHMQYGRKYLALRGTDRLLLYCLSV